MDPSGNPLPTIGVASVEGIREVFQQEDPMDYQLWIDINTPLSNAVEMDRHMRPGRFGVGFAVANPEMLKRKVAAAGCAEAAIERIQHSIDDIDRKIANTRHQIGLQEDRIVRGMDAVRVGPSINHRALPYEQVIYESTEAIPNVSYLHHRHQSNKTKLRSRGLDAQSQLEWWQANLGALRRKEQAETAFRDALQASRDELRSRLLERETVLGCGYSEMGSCTDISNTSKNQSIVTDPSRKSTLPATRLCRIESLSATHLV